MPFRRFSNRPKERIPFTGYATSPQYLVLNVSWVDYQFDHGNLFYRKLPPRDIIEIVANIPTYVDYDQAIVDQIEVRFEPDEHNLLDLELTELLVTDVVTMFYEFMQGYIPDNIESYLFKEWTDLRRNELIMVRQDILTR